MFFKLFTVFIFAPAFIYGSYLNNVDSGTFIDIGKKSGLDEIETPKLEVSINPKYSLVDNVISKSSRILDLSQCFIDDNGNESCLKHETVCDNHISYDDTIVAEHSSEVIDYDKVNHKYIDTFSINLPKNKTAGGVTRSATIVINKLSDIKSFILVRTSVDDLMELFINGKKVYQRSANNHVSSSCMHSPYYEVIGQVIACAKNKKNIVPETGGFWRDSPNVKLKKYLKKGKNTITVKHWLGGGSGGFYTDFEIVRKSDAADSISCPSCKDESHIICNAGYTDDTHGNCVKTIKYKYYSYKCNSGYVAKDSGRSTCVKTDIDHSKNNTDSLSGNCNSNTPSSENCYKSWTTCPLDSSKECTYKGSEYTIFLPLKKFIFKKDSFFKKWEFGKTRGWDCNTFDGSKQNSCQFGIKKVEVKNNEICFTDMHDYKDCIPFLDKSQCRLSGKLESLSGPLLGAFVSKDGHYLYTRDDFSGDESTIFNSLSFDGPKSYFSLKPAPFSFKKEFSISLDLKYSSGNGNIFNKEDSYELGIHEDGSIAYALKSKNTKKWAWINTGIFINKNKTYNVKFIYNGNKKYVRIYIDNSLLYDSSKNGTLGTWGYNSAHSYLIPDELYQTNDNLFFGNSRSKRSQYIGTIDNIKIYNIALSDYEAKKNNFNGVIGFYDFEGNKPYSDKTSNGNDGTVFGDTSLKHNGATPSENAIHSNCILNGKIGFQDVGLGTISVNGDKNRLTFWNSYNSKMVGFLDVLPKINTSNKENSTIFFSFDNIINGIDRDSAFTGKSSDIAGSFPDENIVKGYEDNGLLLSSSDSKPFSIHPSYDTKFSKNNSFSISLWVKILNKPINNGVLLAMKNNFSLEITNSLKFRLKLSKINASSPYIYFDGNLNLDDWHQVVISSSDSEPFIMIDGKKTTFSQKATLSNGGVDAIYIGSDFNGKNMINAVVDNLSFSNDPITRTQGKLSYLSKNAKISDYVGLKNNEVKNLLDNGFQLLYKSKKNHTYMVYGSKITGVECLRKINGTTFSLASADANLANFENRNTTVIQNIIDSRCKDSSLDVCINFPESEACADLNLSKDGNDTAEIAQEVLNACDEDNLIRGISYESFNYKYSSLADKEYCVIESADTTPVDFYNENFIKMKVKNASNNVDKFVCSDLSCNSNHVCGEAKCPEHTSGNIGVSKGYLGCINNVCDFGKNYFQTCGSYTGCPAGDDIVSSSLVSSKSTMKSVEILSGGFDIGEAKRKREIDINDKKVMSLSRSWNVLTLDNKYNILSKKTFDVHEKMSEAKKLEDYLKSIKKGTLTIVATYDEPQRNTSNNSSLLSAMDDFGMDVSIIRRFTYRNAYVFVGKKGKEYKPMYEIHVDRYSSGIDLKFMLNDIITDSKCYKITCPSGSMLDPNTKKCLKIGCDDKSILKGDKCISTVVQ